MLSNLVQVRYQRMWEWQVKAKQRKVNFKVAAKFGKLYSVATGCISGRKFGQNNYKRNESTILFFASQVPLDAINDKSIIHRMICTEQKIDCAGISKMPNAQCNACFGSLRSWAAFSYKTKTAKLKIRFSVICNCFWSKLAHLNCINWKITALNYLSNLFPFLKKKIKSGFLPSP